MLCVADAVPGVALGIRPELAGLLLVRPCREAGGRVREVLGTGGQPVVLRRGGSQRRALWRRARSLLVRHGRRRGVPGEAAVAEGRPGPGPGRCRLRGDGRRRRASPDLPDLVE